MYANYTAEELLRIVNGNAWHGPSLRELLRDLNAEQAVAHPLPGRHSIWKIVNHITVWHETVKLRINGEAMEPEGEDDWPPVSDTDGDAWLRACDKLYASANEAAESIRSVTDSMMNETVPGKSYPFHIILNGLLCHDACHAGQISLIRKVLEGSGS